MRLKVALTASVLAFAFTGSTAIGQGPTTVFTPRRRAAFPVPAGPAARLPPRDRARTAAKGTASIRGRVTAAGTTTPLRRAQVAGHRRPTAARAIHHDDQRRGPVRGAGAAGGPLLHQRHQGRLRQPAVRPAPAVRAGHAGGRWRTGRRSPDWTWRCRSGSVIAGRITDEFGEPVAQAQVSAQRYQYGPDGQRRLQPVRDPVTTDDLGQFRLHSLMPGEYIVSATFRSKFVAIRRPPAAATRAKAFCPPSTRVRSTSAKRSRSRSRSARSHPCSSP